MFEEPIVVHASKEDSDGVRRDGTVRGTVIVGSGLNSAAGATVHAETADRVSVVIRRREWLSAYPFPPRFGMKLGLVRLGEVTVKAVQVSENDFTLRCAKNMRARER